MCLGSASYPSDVHPFSGERHPETSLLLSGKTFQHLCNMQIISDLHGFSDKGALFCVFCMRQLRTRQTGTPLGVNVILNLFQDLNRHFDLWSKWLLFFIRIVTIQLLIIY